MDTRDLVLVGTSAGGVDALPRMAAQLPADFPATILVVQHLAPASSGHLVEIVQRASTMPVSWAEDGDTLEIGRILVGPPDVHMMVDGERVILAGGPRENYSRPSINRLFRSAAACCAGRSIGVLLTGMLDDGVAGLSAIERAGGVTVVQDPADAAYPEMPRNAIASMQVDHVVSLDGLGPLLLRLTAEGSTRGRPPEHVQLEAKIDREDFADPGELERLGRQTPLSCPECGGPMWEAGEPPARTYRCYLGHAATGREMLRRQDQEIERALWAAVRALQERATTWSRLAADSRAFGHDITAVDYDRRSREAHEQAARARAFLLELQRPK
jgi:two-component system chemotaxis response regulator CheB